MAAAPVYARFDDDDGAGDKDDFSDDERDQLDNDGRDGSRKRPAAGDDDDDAVTEAAYLAQVKSLMGTLSGPGPLGGGGHQNALQPWVNRYGPTFRSLAGLLTAFVQDESKHRVTVHMKDDRILVGTIIAVDEHMNIRLDDAKYSGKREKLANDGGGAGAESSSSTWGSGAGAGSSSLRAGDRGSGERVEIKAKNIRFIALEDTEQVGAALYKHTRKLESSVRGSRYHVFQKSKRTVAAVHAPIG